MINARLTNIRLTVMCLVAAALAVPASTSTATTSVMTSPISSAGTALADAEISSESRLLDAFVTDLGRFDKKTADLARKVSFTSSELEGQQRVADDLKRRLSAVQNALRQIIIKLKASGEWGKLDEAVLTQVSDSAFQEISRREGFKRTLEEAASGLTNSANDISRPLDALRSKVKAQLQEPVSEPLRARLAGRPLPVSYSRSGPVFNVSFKCRVAFLRVGFSRAINSSGQASTIAATALKCYCGTGFQDVTQAACDAL